MSVRLWHKCVWLQVWCTCGCKGYLDGASRFISIEGGGGQMTTTILATMRITGWPVRFLRLRPCGLRAAGLLILSIITCCAAKNHPQAYAVSNAVCELKPLLTCHSLQHPYSSAEFKSAIEGSGNNVDSATLRAAIGWGLPMVDPVVCRASCAVQQISAEAVTSVTIKHARINYLDPIAHLHDNGGGMLISNGHGLNSGTSLTQRVMLRRSALRNPVIIYFLGGLMLVCLGLLLGSSWTVQALETKLQRQAEERHKLNEEWLAIRAARQLQGKCARCESRLFEQRWRIPPDY